MFYNTIINESNNDILANVPDVEFQHEASYEGMLMSILETEKNYSAMMEAVAINELNYFAENGTEMIYENAQVRSFFQKIKDFFMKIWEKIKGFFIKFFRWIDMVVKSDKDFVTKYRKLLTTIDTKDFEYKGYVFSIDESDNIEAKFDKALSEIKGINGLKKDAEGISKDYDVAGLKTTITDIAEKEESYMNKARGVFVGQNSCDSSDFSQELYKTFRSDADKPDTIKNVNVNSLLEFIENAKKNKKSAEDDMKKFNEKIKEIIKKIEGMEKKILAVKEIPNEVAGACITSVNTVAKYNKSILSLAQQYSGAKVSAIKQRNRQAKATCIRLSTYKVTNNSATVTENALDGVKFI